MKIIKHQIIELSNLIYPEMVANRRYLHQYPELSFEEYNTSRFICSKLDEYGIEYQNNIVKTGVVAYIKGRKPRSRMIALRADIDALPIQEENNWEYRSQNEGIMHACGHDMHTASLLGTAAILNKMRDEYEGTIMLIFQPAEERLPGGARLMLEAGIFDKRKPNLILAQHVQPTMNTGTVGFRPGMYMASCDEFYIIIKGKGGHGAMPHQLNDSVVTSSHIIVALQQIVSRNALASSPTVLSFGKVIANGATNIIPDEVHIEVTFRTVDERWRSTAHAKMINMATLIAESMGCTCEFKIIKGEPVLINDELITARAKMFATELLGQKNVQKLDILMTSEDFAHFTHEFPCTYYRLGVKGAGMTMYPQHSSHFTIDDNALRTGAGLMAWLTTRFLSQKAEVVEMQNGYESLFDAVY
jgi:amidohydrolase